MSTTISRLGYVSSLLAFLATLGYGIAQIAQLTGLIRFPWDEILIYSFSLCISIPFLASLVVLHYTMPDNKKPWTHIALCLGTCYIVFAFIVYTVQLGIVLPALHPTASSPLLTLTPHSLFWTLDGLAYISMGIAVLFIVPALGRSHPTKYLRSFLLAHGLFTPVVAFEYFYPGFSTSLLYLASPWLVTACGSFLLMAMYFKNT